MVSNELGKMVLFTWNDLPNHNQHIILDEFVIMPNHFHGIIFINAGAGSNIAGAGLDIVGVDLNVAVGAGSEPAPTMNTMKKRHGLPEIVRQFKTFSARRINKNRGTSGAPVWQRNYWEQIIRNEKSLNNFRQYIIQNPSNWQTDAENPVPSD
ncbi:transposase [Acidobacteriota bacterium]